MTPYRMIACDPYWHAAAVRIWGPNTQWSAELAHDVAMQIYIAETFPL